MIHDLPCLSFQKKIQPSKNHKVEFKFRTLILPQYNKEQGWVNLAAIQTCYGGFTQIEPSLIVSV